ncbi:hypothetical protein [Curtobacterium sp. MCBD17_040]|uniref:hypothetical protein n=1 Tax=Curtobacterium sp. MCBD17_040 TaxID=2175674 RepID=UPI0011B59EB5|nr:hypothetical protein [Curtobacterium sp. MCBD17_040]WIB65323.1 hypothetical protein DEI94_18120 [Curtobacterium sp. MCBD17_040]
MVAFTVCVPAVVVVKVVEPSAAVTAFECRSVAVVRVLRSAPAMEVSQAVSGMTVAVFGSVITGDDVVVVRARGSMWMWTVPCPQVPSFAHAVYVNVTGSPPAGAAGGAVVTGWSAPVETSAAGTPAVALVGAAAAGGVAAGAGSSVGDGVGSVG